MTSSGGSALCGGACGLLLTLHCHTQTFLRHLPRAPRPRFFSTHMQLLSQSSLKTSLWEVASLHFTMEETSQKKGASYLDPVEMTLTSAGGLCWAQQVD